MKLILVFLFMFSSYDDNISYKVINNKLIFNSNNIEIKLPVYESKVIRVSKFENYILIYLENNKIYVFKKDCENIAIFNNYDEFIKYYIKDDIEIML